MSQKLEQKPVHWPTLNTVIMVEDTLKNMDESFDHVIRNEGEFMQKLKYIANNPIKAELAERYENYKWLYLKGWINEYSQTEGHLH